MIDLTEMNRFMDETLAQIVAGEEGERLAAEALGMEPPTAGYEFDDGFVATFYCPACVDELDEEELEAALDGGCSLIAKTAEECVAEIDGLPVRCATCQKELV